MILRPIQIMAVNGSANLKFARAVVACGAGVRDEETFDLVRQLADALGATIAGTRPAVDRGFIEHDRMIGQTGVTVRPDLYIALGISGSWQHQTGMEEAGTIVAVNADPRAPIFSLAHFGIIGDLREVLPEMLAAVRGGSTIEQFAETHALRSH
jgi:electron transfer flavoprotein alpha subunit